jgi:hypothetical protein
VTECTFHGTDPSRRCGPVAAVLEIDPFESGRTHSTPHLCFRHLNHWLDSADVRLWLEPTTLRFLDAPVSTSSVRWLWWSHDPDGIDDAVGQIRIAGR